MKKNMKADWSFIFASVPQCVFCAIQNQETISIRFYHDDEIFPHITLSRKGDKCKTCPSQARYYAWRCSSPKEGYNMMIDLAKGLSDARKAIAERIKAMYGEI